MRIKSFAVRNYANLLGQVELSPMREFNVIHGPSSAGKSNLLRAIELYLLLLGASESVSKQQVQGLEHAAGRFSELIQGAFNRDEPGSVQFRVVWTLEDEDLARSGLSREIPGSSLITQIELRELNRKMETTVQQWQFGDTDVAILDRMKDPASVGYAQQVRRLLSDAFPFKFEAPVPPLDTSDDRGELLPQSLLDRLFDHRQSARPEERARWALFARLGGELAVELGPGEWETSFDRETGRAGLLWVTESGIRDRRLFSDGVQRYVALIAQLCLFELRYLALSEPEWKLSPELQQRYASAARRVASSSLGPSQLFATSHSPALAAAGQPFLLRWQDGEPVAEQTAPSGAPPEAAADDGASDDLDSLIGLVDELSTIDPEKLAAEDAAAAGRR